jgi:hypothetical protein
MSAPIRTVTVPDGVISTSGEPSGGGGRRRGVKTAEQTATTARRSPLGPRAGDGARRVRTPEAGAM